MNLNNYNWVIFGGGAVVREYHLPAYEFLGLDNQLIVVDNNKSNLESISLNFPNIKTEFCDCLDFVDKFNFDKNTLALIALPNFLHKSISIKLINKGVNILCEKPLCLNREDVAELDIYALKSNILLSSAMVRRFMPSYLALKDSLKDKNILSVNVSDGGPYAWSANSSNIFSKSNGGVLADMGIHYLDLLADLFGELTLIDYNDDNSGGVEANCECNLITNNGIAVNLKLSRTDYLDNTFFVSTDSGDYYIKKDVFDKCFFNVGNVTHEIKINKAYSHNLIYSFNSCFVEQIVQFVNAVNEKNINYIRPISQYNSIGIIEDAYSNNKSITKDYTDKVFITGGSGFIGTELIKSLVSEKYEIIAPMHTYNNCSEIARYNINMPKLNLFDFENLRNTIRGSKYVIHLAYSSNVDDAYKINFEGTKNVVNAAIEEGVEAIVILSTMYVFGHHEMEQPIDETIGYHPYGGIYAKSKLIMEKWCLQKAKNTHNTRIVILNPSCVYGPNGKTYTRLPYDLMLNNKFAWFDSGEGIANFVYIDNLIHAIKLALKNKDAHGHNFIINDGHSTWREFILPFLIDKKDQFIPNYKKGELNEISKSHSKSLKEVIQMLLSNYDFLVLINSNRLLFNIKRYIIKLFPTSKSSIIDIRTRSNLKLNHQIEVKYNTPQWLEELFPNTKTKFSSDKAKKILGWHPIISNNEAKKITINWLNKHYNIK